MRLNNKLIKKIENQGFCVVEDGDSYCFRRYSNAGQDFCFDVEKGETLTDFASNVLDYWESFDVSEAAYIWLDSSGHGTHGAPYEMIDVYNDMKECKDYILELYEIIMGERK